LAAQIDGDATRRIARRPNRLVDARRRSSEIFTVDVWRSCWTTRRML